MSDSSDVLIIGAGNKQWATREAVDELKLDVSTVKRDIEWIRGAVGRIEGKMNGDGAAKH